MKARVLSKRPGRKPKKISALARRPTCRDCCFRAPSGACLDLLLTSGRCGDYARYVCGISHCLASAANFGLLLPDVGRQAIFTIYAWNEFGESGIVAPARGDRAMKLEAIGAVFGPLAKTGEQADTD